MVITIAQDAKGCGFESRLTHNMKQKDYHKPGYWKDWYWNKGGREKVNLSKKVNQVLNRIEKEKKVLA